MCVFYSDFNVTWKQRSYSALILWPVLHFLARFSDGLGGETILYRALITMDLSFFYFTDQRNRSEIYDGLFRYLFFE